jgi:putative ABC transport system ATP-binding protein
LVGLRRGYFGFSFQNSTLSSYLTVIENIAYPLLVQGISWQLAGEQAKTTLRAVLLSHEQLVSLAQRFPNQLSGGQRQRVALAQALVHNPYVLFADEPTGQVDLPSRQQVMNVLKRWVAKHPG